jgi:hypothetical protein
MPEHISSVIPGKGGLLGHRVMATPTVVIELFKGLHDSGAEWIQVDIADQFHEIGVFFTDNRGVAVLEEVAAL